MLTPSVGLRVNDLLGALGIPGGMIGAQIDQSMGNQVGMLKNLADAYQEAATGRATNGLQRAIGSGSIPPFLNMASPMSQIGQMGPLCGAGYAGGFQHMDLAPGSGSGLMSRLFDPRRRSAVKLERLLKRNPIARAAFEQAIGGRIASFGKTDGKMTIQRFPRGFSPMPFAGPFAGAAFSPLGAMSQGILGGAARLGLGAMTGGLLANPFFGATALGLGNIAGGLLGGLGGGLAGGLTGGLPGALAGGLAGALGPIGGLFGGLGGQGVGSWNPNAAPGKINGNHPAQERAHQAEVNGVLQDPSLTVEDKISLMLMLIMKKMDKDIEKQANYINSLQQQQGNRGSGGKKGGGGAKKGGSPLGKIAGGGGGGKKGGGAGQTDSSKSIDVETQKLSRMTQKRGQMFDLLRQIIDKYNETAKGIIQSIGR